MDGFQASEHPIIVIGATYHVEALDPALLRPGRFDRRVCDDLQRATDLAWKMVAQLGMGQALGDQSQRT